MEFTKDIYLNTDKIYENSSLVLLYNGILAQNPEAKVYLRYGYNDTWDNTDELRLKRTESGMLGVLRVSSGNSFKFVFRDNNNSWDNNNEQNYSLPILEKEDTVLEFGPSEVEKAKESTYSEASEEFEFKTEDILETNVIESDNIELESATIEKETVSYNIEYSKIPAKTLINKVQYDSFTNTFSISEAVIESDSVKETIAQVDKAFDDLFIENEATSKSTMPDFNFIEDYAFDSHSLVPQESNSISSGSFLFRLKRSIKLAFVKFLKLVRSALNYNEDKNY